MKTLIALFAVAGLAATATGCYHDPYARPVYRHAYYQPAYYGPAYYGGGYYGGGYYRGYPGGYYAGPPRAAYVPPANGGVYVSPAGPPRGVVVGPAAPHAMMPMPMRPMGPPAGRGFGRHW